MPERLVANRHDDGRRALTSTNDILPPAHQRSTFEKTRYGNHRPPVTLPPFALPTTPSGPSRVRRSMYSANGANTCSVTSSTSTSTNPASTSEATYPSRSWKFWYGAEVRRQSSVWTIRVGSGSARLGEGRTRSVMASTPPGRRIRRAWRRNVARVSKLPVVGVLRTKGWMHCSGTDALIGTVHRDRGVPRRFLALLADLDRVALPDLDPVAHPPRRLPRPVDVRAQARDADDASEAEPLDPDRQRVAAPAAELQQARAVPQHGEIGQLEDQPPTRTREVPTFLELVVRLRGPVAHVEPCRLVWEVEDEVVEVVGLLRW